MEKFTDCQIEIKKLRESTGMNRKEFCECFNIPYRTVTEWGKRKLVMLRIISLDCWHIILGWKKYGER